MKIRMIQEEDISTCLSWYNWYIENSTATFETEQLSYDTFAARVHNIRKEYPWIVLEVDGKIRAYGYLGHFNDRAAYDWTADTSVYVAPDERGHGYGKVIMKALIEIAKKCGYKKLVSLITSSNTTSLKMHDYLGFQKIAQFDQFGYKHGTWLGVSHYVYDLTDTFEDNPIKPINIKEV